MYPDSVYVTRSGFVNIPKGKNRLIIRGLPNNIFESSISFGFPNNKNTKIKKIEIKNEIELKYQNEEAKQAKANYEELLEKVDLKNKEYQSVEHHKKMLKNLLPEKRDQTYGITNEINIDSTAWGTFHYIVRDLLEENSKLELEMLKELDQLREELVVAEAKLNYYQNAEQIESKTIEVEVSNPSNSKKKKIAFYLNYIVSKAEWFPRYEVKVDTKEKINILYIYALVRNNTGEDWKNVKMSFSAADHTQTLDFPKIQEWRIGFSERIQLQKRKRIYDSRKNRRESQVFAQEEANEPMPAETTGRITSGDVERFDNSNVNPKKPEQQQVLQERENLVLSDKEKKYQDAQKISKDVLTKNEIQSKSIVTENNLLSLNDNFYKQQTNLKNRNYKAALDFGQKAEENISLLDRKYQRVLSPQIQEIKEMSKRASILKANDKIAAGLISPKVSSGGFDYRYVARNRNTILSDNSFNKVLIGVKKLSSNITYETSPLTKESAFLISTSISKTKEPLLAGPLDIFVKEDYIGTTKIAKTSSGEELRLELGPDNDIKIHRRERKFRDVEGIFIKKNTLKVNIEVKVQNKKAEDILLYFIDRIPYTNDKEIDIEIKKMPKTATLSKQGILKHKLNIKSGESKIVLLEYVIKYPLDTYLREEMRETEKSD